MVRAFLFFFIPVAWMLTSAGCGDDGAAQAPVCDDGVLNGDESDVDCGPGCEPCPLGATCSQDDHCASGRCADGTCEEPPVACTDGQIRCSDAGDAVERCSAGEWRSTTACRIRETCDDSGFPRCVIVPLEPCRAAASARGWLSATEVDTAVECGTATATRSRAPTWPAWASCR